MPVNFLPSSTDYLHFLPEIITFDELYERARFIVHQNEG